MNNTPSPGPATPAREILSPKQKRILILTADTGFGHRSAANAVAAALAARYGGQCECTILNPINDRLAPAFFRQGMRNYDHTVRAHPEFYRLTYEAGDTRVTSAIMESALIVLLLRAMRKILTDIQPDLILSTYHLYNPPLAAALSAAPTSIPFYSIVTDLECVHKLWFQRRLDRLFVPNEEVCAQAIASGLAREKVIASGIPVHPDIPREARSRLQIRSDLGWDPVLPAVLAVGSRRVNHLVPALEGLNRSGLPVQLAVVSGGDEALHCQLQAIAWRLPVHLYRYVENLPSLMHAADLLISKAGGLILAEGLACGLPLILIDAIQGQETGNMAYVSRHQAGAVAQSPQDLLKILGWWLENDGQEMKRVARNASRIGKPAAAAQVADLAWQAIQA